MFASHLASPADQPERDLACADLWERSLERSRRRRDVAAMHRKHAPRRKGISLAMSAALLTSPMVPMASAAGRGDDSAPSTEEWGVADAEGALAGDAILREGDIGAAVAAVQRKLAVDDDGIFGPITEGAVKDFQGRTGLPVTGEVDARTWTALFRTAVSFVPESSPAAEAIQASTSAKPAGDSPAAQPADERESVPSARAASKDKAPARSDDSSDASLQRTATSGGDESDSVSRAATRDDSGDDSSADKSQLDEREGGGRPAKGVNLTTDIDLDAEEDREAHEHKAEKPEREARKSDSEKKSASEQKPAPERKPESDRVVTAGGDCATGELAMPVQGVRTSGFGDGRNHAGIDIGAPMGTAVTAALCGTVTQAGVQGAYGNIVCIRHTSSFSTCYAHLSSINTRQGAYVKVGQLIGRVGSTGRSTGPHLHFETRVNGRGQDPDQYLKSGKRVSGEGSAEGYGTGGGTPPNGTSRPKQQATAAKAQSEPKQQAAPAAEQQAAPAEQQAAPAEQQAAPAEQQAAPAEQQAAPAAKEQAESSPEATVNAQATTPEPEAEPTSAAPAEESAEPVVEAEAEPAVEEPVVEAEAAPAVEEPVVEAETEPAVETPAVEAEAVVEATPAAEPEAPAEPVVEAPAVEAEAEAAPAAPAAEAQAAVEPVVEAPAVAAEATVQAPVVEAAPEAAAAETPAPAPAG